MVDLLFTEKQLGSNLGTVVRKGSGSRKGMTWNPGELLLVSVGINWAWLSNGLTHYEAVSSCGTKDTEAISCSDSGPWQRRGITCMHFCGSIGYLDFLTSGQGCVWLNIHHLGTSYLDIFLFMKCGLLSTLACILATPISLNSIDLIIAFAYIICPQPF